MERARDTRATLAVKFQLHSGRKACTLNNLWTLRICGALFYRQGVLLLKSFKFLCALELCEHVYEKLFRKCNFMSTLVGPMMPRLEELGHWLISYKHLPPAKWTVCCPEQPSSLKAEVLIFIGLLHQTAVVSKQEDQSTQGPALLLGRGRLCRRRRSQGLH